MSTELWTMMESGSGQQAEHEVALYLPGDIETVRGRLVKALERLEYQIVDEQPLFAKRGARGGGKTQTSSRVLDYDIKLFVGLKASSEGAVAATFHYRVKHPMMLKGDKQVLTREAELVAALAKSADKSTNCPVCGTERTTDSRFCRRCGTPLTDAAPAELEILRMTTEAQTAYQWMMGGVIALTLLLLFTVIPFIPGIVFKPKFLIALQWLSVFAGISALALVPALRHLNRVIHPAKEPQALPPQPPRPVELPSAPTSSLHPELPSVTEHTTDLLDRPREKSPVARLRDTR